MCWTYMSQLHQLPVTSVHFVGGLLTWRRNRWSLKSPGACWQFRRHRWPVRGYFLRPVASWNLDFDFFRFGEKISIFDFEYGNRPSLHRLSKCRIPWPAYPNTHQASCLWQVLALSLSQLHPSGPWADMWLCHVIHCPVSFRLPAMLWHLSKTLAAPSQMQAPSHTCPPPQSHAAGREDSPLATDTSKPAIKSTVANTLTTGKNSPFHRLVSIAHTRLVSDCTFQLYFVIQIFCYYLHSLILMLYIHWQSDTIFKAKNLVCQSLVITPTRWFSEST